MEDDILLKAKINSETAQIKWHELQRFFAAGKVLKVKKDLDLVDVAFQLATNKTQDIQQLIANECIEFVSDDDAKAWLNNHKILWASVIKPWVLVQVS